MADTNMSISEGIKSLLKSTLNFVQWIRFNMNSCIEIGHNTKVRGAVLSQNVKIGSHCNIQRGGVNSFSYMGDYCELPQVKIGKLLLYCRACDTGGRKSPYELYKYFPIYILKNQKFICRSTTV